MNRFLKRSLITMGAAFAVAATGVVLEWDGYAAFDADDGDNVLCDLDPDCRKWTKGEIAMVREFFSDRIDYKNVKLFTRSFMRVAGTEKCALSPNGHLYAPGPKDEKTTDFSTASFAKRLHFIHEATHIWQKQSGRDVLVEAWDEFVKHDYNYGAVYSYTITPDTVFSDLNLEQQAKLVENFARARFTLHSMQVYNFKGAPLESACTTLRPLEKILAPVFGLKPEEACIIPDSPVKKETKRSRGKKKPQNPPKPIPDQPIKFDFSGCFDVEHAP